MATTATQPETATAPAGLHALARARHEVIPVSGGLAAARALPPGTTITVTCSPRHGIETTVTTAFTLAAEGYRAVPHIAARLVPDRAYLEGLLDRLADHGLEDIFVVGGDAPRAAGPYPGGLELLRAIQDSGRPPGCIGVPAYPEAHASIPGDVLRQAFRAKNELADYAVTQICFEAETITDWLATERDAGLRLPVYLGMPGVVDRGKLLGLATRIGLGASTRVLRRQGGLASRLFGASTYRPDELIQRLLPAFNGPLSPHLAGFHFNTFNQVAATQAWLEETLAALTPDEPAAQSSQQDQGPIMTPASS